MALRPSVILGFGLTFAGWLLLWDAVDPRVYWGIAAVVVGYDIARHT
jgi:hypothetical protein